MLTRFGVFLRKLRLDHGEVLKNMSEKLGVSVSFLSAVENGKKKIPKDWEVKLIEEYSLDVNQKAELKSSIDSTLKSIDIDMEEFDENKKDLAITFARKINSLNEEDLKKIRELLNKEGL